MAGSPARALILSCVIALLLPTPQLAASNEPALAPGVNRCILTEHDHREQQRFLKTRYQNWPTETAGQNGAFALPFATRRPHNTSQRLRIRAHSVPNPKEMKNRDLLAQAAVQVEPVSTPNSCYQGK
jgi:hypothetical protein